MNSFNSLNKFAFSSLIALACTTAACTGATSNDDGEDLTGASTDAITDVNHSAVKRQSIGNCWIYATASWAESLNKSASPTDTAKNLSESYWTYWHWFEQIANSRTSEVSTGGSYDTAVALITRYGMMNEADFIPEEAEVEMSARQASALKAINLSLKSGALRFAIMRRNRALVRSEMDKAWGLSPAVTAQLDTAFGSNVARTLDRSASNAGTKILKSSELAVKLVDPTTHAPVDAKLSDAIGSVGGFGGHAGRLAWNTVSYGSDSTSRRTFLKRVQKALADKQPVVMSWFVDFNSLDSEGRFFAPAATPGRQGGHMVVLEDYQISNVPGFGTLKAGELATTDQLTAALDDSAKFEFIRVKNSWGNYRSDRAFVTPGYHDLYMAYLNGPVKQCDTDADENPNLNSCWDTTPLEDVVLPAGY